MNGRDRFLTALKGGKPDRVSIFDFFGSPKFIKRLTGYKPLHYRAEDIIECSLKFGFDGAYIAYGGVKGYNAKKIRDDTLNQNCYRDDWGTVYRKSNFSWPIDAPIDYPIKDWHDLKKYSMPDPELMERMDEINRAQELAGNKTAIVGGIHGPLTVATLLCGFDNLFIKIIDDPNFVKEVFKIGTEYFKVAVKRMTASGIDAICVSDDLGSDTAPFFSPKHFKTLLYPFIEELFHEISVNNVPFFMHCDGNINLLLDNLVSLGINGLHPIQRQSGMSIKDIRKKYGNRICVIGNVDSSHTLVSGGKSEIIRETLEALRDGAGDGAMILASDSDIRDEIPFENIELMFKTGMKYGKYPIDMDLINERIDECKAGL